MPDRHTLVAHLIAGREVVDAVNGLLPVCARIFSESPGNLSPSLYWFRDSTLVRVSSIGEGGALQFVPPEGLVAVLNEIVG